MQALTLLLSRERETRAGMKNYFASTLRNYGARVRLLFLGEISRDVR